MSWMMNVRNTILSFLVIFSFIATHSAIADDEAHEGDNQARRKVDDSLFFDFKFFTNDVLSEDKIQVSDGLGDFKIKKRNQREDYQLSKKESDKIRTFFKDLEAFERDRQAFCYDKGEEASLGSSDFVLKEYLPTLMKWRDTTHKAIDMEEKGRVKRKTRLGILTIILVRSMDLHIELLRKKGENEQADREQKLRDGFIDFAHAMSVKIPRKKDKIAKMVNDRAGIIFPTLDKDGEFSKMGKHLEALKKAIEKANAARPEDKEDKDEVRACLLKEEPGGDDDGETGDEDDSDDDGKPGDESEGGDEDDSDDDGKTGDESEGGDEEDGDESDDTSDGGGPIADVGKDGREESGDRGQGSRNGDRGQGDRDRGAGAGTDGGGPRSISIPPRNDDGDDELNRLLRAIPGMIGQALEGLNRLAQQQPFQQPQQQTPTPPQSDSGSGSGETPQPAPPSSGSGESPQTAQTPTPNQVGEPKPEDNQQPPPPGPLPLAQNNNDNEDPFKKQDNRSNNDELLKLLAQRNNRDENADRRRRDFEVEPLQPRNNNNQQFLQNLLAGFFQQPQAPVQQPQRPQNTSLVGLLQAPINRGGLTRGPAQPISRAVNGTAARSAGSQCVADGRC